MCQSSGIICRAVLSGENRDRLDALQNQITGNHAEAERVQSAAQAP
jgi:hypothetical protein